ncbi:cytochrome c biogenesis CcdA family protein [Catenuloplanes atrovinosus]|uniref:Cytochrome c biogenesis protein CcdA n=1 Tax=Catenuloplanes atrovinosus TaxID=137266 RepID=A0AAE4CDZ0_9ACTN|nr:cytochrome c biogenesis protein CcdA [Catenuloplanes atrovinosus]MDR7278040.1 cytochrome c biogenesis protein CcdA [Catenuloplanes atrovinosus]
MDTAGLLLALTAGMLAAFNPCGFAMLPAYLSVLVAADAPGGRWAAAGRVVTSTLAMTAGFVAVFGTLGFALAPAMGWLQPRLPWLTLASGAILAVLGVLLATGRRLPSLPLIRRAPALTRSLPSMALFGAAYALASVSCTIVPFLAIVGVSLSGGSAALFGAYAAGMALVVGVTALAVALVRTSLLSRVRRASAVAPRAGGVLLAVAGLYITYYGWYELRVLHDARWAGADPVVEAALGVQEALVSTVERIGVLPLVAAFGVLLLAVGLIRRGRLGAE